MVYVSFFFYKTKIRGHSILQKCFEVCNLYSLLAVWVQGCHLQWGSPSPCSPLLHLQQCTCILATRSNAKWVCCIAMGRCTLHTLQGETKLNTSVRAQPLPCVATFKWTYLKSDKSCRYLFFSSFSYALVYSEWKLLLTILSKTQKQLSYTMVE